MNRHATIFLILLFTINLNAFAQEEVDKVWSEISRTVAEGDFEGYAATYHLDAVLVNGISGTSYPIANALAGWKQGFDDTKAGKMSGKVEFRFSERLSSETTAHDTGIFKYSSKSKGGEWEDVHIHFQALFAKVEGKWKMMMEYQISRATEEEWDELN